MEEVFEVGGVERVSVEEALAGLAVFGLERQELSGCFDAFSYRLQAEGPAELDEGMDDGAGFAAGGERGDE